MFERFSDRANKIMALANQEAHRFNHEYIDTEHILLGLVTEGSGIGAAVLKKLDVDLKKLRIEVEKLIKPGPDIAVMGKLPQSPRAKNVIEHAIEEGRALNHNYVGTEHLLLGLIREDEGIAAQVLMDLGVKLEDVRQEVLQLLNRGGETLVRNVIEELGKTHDDMRKLRKIFMGFLTDKKKWPPNYIQDFVVSGYAEKTGQGNLSIIEPNSRKIIAIIEFKRSNTPNVLQNANRQVRLHRDALNQPNILGYIVCPARKNLRHPFDIYLLSEKREPEFVTVEDFPEYEGSKPAVPDKKLSISDFNSKLTGIGKELLDKLIKLIEMDPAFRIEVATSNYINIRIKTPRRVALQIHRVADDSSQLGIAIAGWSEQDPEIRNKYAIGRHNIGRLRGFLDSTQEQYWLRGKIDSGAKGNFPPYEAKVYIIDPGMQDDEEAWGELKELLQYTKEITGKGKTEVIVSDNVKVEDSVAAEIIGKSQLRGMSVAEHGWGDRVANKDKLGFRPYVEVVARFLTHEETELPLTLSVEGEWGSGKSSFLSQLKDEIRRIYKDKCQKEAFIVEFDPWRHDKDEALWAAFALTFLEQVRGGFFELRRWVGDRHLFFMRYKWKDGWIDMVKFFTFWLAFIVLCVLLGLLAIRRGPEWISNLCDNVLLFVEDAKTKAGKDSSGGVSGILVIKWILGGGGLAAVAGVLASLLGLVRRITGNPLKVNLKKYIKHPQYADRVSFIERFHNDFHKIVSAYSGKDRVYVFIDDLDRCAIPKAAELMESINLMISENPRLVFVMGMDREKVAAGLAVKHEKILPYLAEQTEKKDVEKDEAKRLRGVRYGYSFIEKFIQVPFILPQPDEKCIKKMLMGMSGQLKQEVLPDESKVEMPETVKVDVPHTQIEEDKELETQKRAIRQEQIKEEFLKFDGDDPTFQAIVLMVSKVFDYNPRRAIQFVNIFRLRAATAKVTGLYEPKDGKRLTFEQLGKFVGIGLGWPLMIRDIERRPELLEELVGEAEERTEVEANEKKPKANGLYFERWSDDEKLMELLKAGCEKEKDEKKYRLFSLKGLDVKRLLQVVPRVMNVEEKIV